MAGITLRLIEFTNFDFTSLAALGQTTIWLADNIPTHGHRNGQLIVRFRSINLGNASSSVNLSLVPDAPTPEDPGKFYRDGGKIFPVGGVGPFGVFNTSALLFTGAVTTDSVPLPAFMSLQMVVSQPAAGAALTFTINVDLALVE